MGRISAAPIFPREKKDNRNAQKIATPFSCSGSVQNVEYVPMYRSGSSSSPTRSPSMGGRRPAATSGAERSFRLDKELEVGRRYLAARRSRALVEVVSAPRRDAPEALERTLITCVITTRDIVRARRTRAAASATAAPQSTVSVEAETAKRWLFAYINVF